MKAPKPPLSEVVAGVLEPEKVETAKPASKPFDRVAYQRDYMRKRRLARSGGAVSKGDE